MKVKKKVITDHCGSSSQTRAIIREVLWGLVSKVQDDSVENAEIAPAAHFSAKVQETTEEDVVALPIEFKSKNSRKRKGGRDTVDSSAKKKQYKGLTSTLAVPKYNGTLLEENVYAISTHKRFAGMILRVVGSGSLLPSGATVIGRVLGKCGDAVTDDAFTVIEIPRKSLAIIPAIDRHEAHKLVQIDEQRILTTDMPPGVHLKYWDQRYRLLSLFDQGIKLDAESWFSITPEAVAKHVTSSCIGRAREWKCRMNKVLDCFSGCGGNTIPFAALGRQVVSVDLDPVKLDYLRHNCGVYGVDSTRVETVCAEVYQLLSWLIEPSELQRIKDKYNKILKDAAEEGTEEAEVEKEDHSRLTETESGEHSVENADPNAVEYSVPTDAEIRSSSSATEALANTSTSSSSSEPIDAPSAQSPPGSPNTIDADILALCTSPDLIILSPPWGGPDYLNAKVYDLYTMLTSGCGLYLTMLAAAVASNLLLLMPVNTSLEQIEYIAEVVQMPYVVEIVSINNAPKVMAIYMGNFVAKKKIPVSETLVDTDSSSHIHIHFAAD